MSVVEAPTGKRDTRFKGEIIVERRENLDFSLSFSKITEGLRAKLPNYSYEERISHYNFRLASVFLQIEEKGKSK